MRCAASHFAPRRLTLSFSAKGTSSNNRSTGPPIAAEGPACRADVAGRLAAATGLARIGGAATTRSVPSISVSTYRSPSLVVVIVMYGGSNGGVLFMSLSKKWDSRPQERRTVATGVWHHRPAFSDCIAKGSTLQHRMLLLPIRHMPGHQTPECLGVAFFDGMAQFVDDNVILHTGRQLHHPGMK